ncbi:MAG: hypothetical protein GX638_18150, partial [Crenarchaeota archaeon]|nr:hypothetical protein [Thermoproteota archaeon]
MKFKKNKEIFCVLFLVLMLFFSALLICADPVAAHDPPQDIQTFAYISAAPNPIGINQNVIIYMWLDKAPPTASGSYGDRWEGFKLTITKPDGSTEIQDCLSTDAVGFSWLMYTPSQVGMYSLKFEFPGQILAGNNLDPFNFFGGTEYIGDYYKPSSSEITLTVQNEQIEAYPEPDFPTGAWTRPINPE